MFISVPRLEAPTFGCDSVANAFFSFIAQGKK